MELVFPVAERDHQYAVHEGSYEGERQRRLRSARSSARSVRAASGTASLAQATCRDSVTGIMIQGAQLMAFVATSQAELALAFYRDVVGLRFVSDDPFALVFESGATLLRIQKVQEHRALPYTALGWTVPDLELAARELVGRGARFERFSGMDQDELGIWNSSSGARIAWFKDPDGNVLSLTQF